jgi:uncharacterized hydrophobic protein (TIGR00341 family)
MPERLITIVLPENQGPEALAVMEKQDQLTFWQEESADGHFVLSVLTDLDQSEHIMDLFQRSFSLTKGFRLILLPVEASLPRVEPPKPPPDPETPDKKRFNLRIGARISREELYADLADSAHLSNLFVAMLVLATIVAAIGLVHSNVAVIIGAMVIAPLLGPNVALALATCLADWKLGRDAMKTLLAGMVIAMVLSVSMGWMLDVDPSTPEIANRTQAGLSDVILALASGCAGVLAFTTGISAAVIGVMVAVALLPPLTACGLLIGAGFYPEAMAAFVLFGTNVICVDIAGLTTFLIQGIGPRSWWESDRAKRATRNALLIWMATLALLVGAILLWQY